MKIVAVNITPVAIPRSSTLATSYGSMDMAETIVVELVTDEGLIGWGQSAVDAPYSSLSLRLLSYRESLSIKRIYSAVHSNPNQENF